MKTANTGNIIQKHPLQTSNKSQAKNQPTHKPTRFDKVFLVAPPSGGKAVTICDDSSRDAIFFREKQKCPLDIQRPSEKVFGPPKFAKKHQASGGF